MFLLIEYLRFDFTVWAGFFSHLTTLISITHHFKAKCILPMMSQFKNPLETKFHLIELAWVQRRLRKFPLHGWGKPTREPFYTLVSCRLAGCWVFSGKGRTTKDHAGWSSAVQEALLRACLHESSQSLCCRPFTKGGSQAPLLGKTALFGGWGWRCLGERIYILK